MAENDPTLQEMAFTAGYWTEGVVRGTFAFLVPALVFATALGISYLAIDKVISYVTRKRGA